MRSEHWTDVAIANARRRLVSSGCNHRLPGSDWLPTVDADPAVAVGIPPNWEGPFDFALAKANAPLQAYAGDTASVDNTALIQLCPSDRPLMWMRLRALGITIGTPWELVTNGRAVRWVDLWPNCNLRWVFARRQAVKAIRIKRQPHPWAFVFALEVPPRLTASVVDNRLVVRSSINGEGIFHSTTPFVEDANGTLYPAQLLDDGLTAQGAMRLKLQLDSNLLTDAAYPLILDPTTTISGTSDIEEANLRAAGADNNFGGWDQDRVESTSGGRNGVWRIATSAIPSGTISAVRFLHQFQLGSLSAMGYRILPGNTWVEGNSVNAIESGACCWNYRQYNTLAWLGGNNGCSVSGTDHDATVVISDAGGSVGSYISADFNSDGLAMFQGWKAGSFANEGWVMKRISGGSTWNPRSSEHATTPAYFEIDYTVGPATSPYYFDMLLRNRRR